MIAYGHRHYFHVVGGEVLRVLVYAVFEFEPDILYLCSIISLYLDFFVSSKAHFNYFGVEDVVGDEEEG